MKKHITTKRALLASVLAVALCFAMLIGTTFAWFTDTASSKNNKIQSGTLQIDLLERDGNGDYNSIKENSTALFDYDKWEPGYTLVKNVAVQNLGSLALQYTMKIVPMGTVSDLANVIDVYYAADEVLVADRTEFDAAVADGNLVKLGTLADVMNGAANTVIKDTLIPTDNEIDYATIALKMQETAGNAYQNKSIADSFDLNIIATQYTYESDSFNDQYDVNATYLNKDADGNYLIGSAAELYYFAETVNSTHGETYTGETVKLTADIDLNNKLWTPIGTLNASDGNGAPGFNGTFDGNGHTIKNLMINVNDNAVGFFATNAVYHDAVIKNLTIDNANVTGNKWVGVIQGYTYATVQNCAVTNSTVTATVKRGGAIVGFADNTAIINGNTASNCTINLGTAVSEDHNACVGTYIGANSAANLATNTDSGCTVNIIP